MAEPSGMVASILAFVTTTYTSTQFLYETVHDIKHAPEEMQDIRKDLDALGQILILLK